MLVEHIRHSSRYCGKRIGIPTYGNGFLYAIFVIRRFEKGKYGYGNASLATLVKKNILRASRQW